MPAACPAVRVTQHGGTTGTEAADGFIYFAKALASPGEIWRVPIGGGAETLRWRMV